MNPAIIDPHAIETLRSLDPAGGDDFLREVIAIFLDDTPQRIAELESSLAARNVAGFVRAAHTIKGSAANLGAMSLRTIAEGLEQRAKREGLTEGESGVGQVRAAYAEACGELTRIYAPRK